MIAELASATARRALGAAAVESRTSGDGHRAGEVYPASLRRVADAVNGTGLSTAHQRSRARSARACARLSATSLPAWSRITSL